jgi:hypothetical protein
MREAFGAYTRFAGADSVEWASHLDEELRLLGGRR